MDNQRLWQHRSKEEDKEAILSLNLLERANVPKEKTLKCIYAVSNHIEEHYREVFIPKKKGGRRKLLVPDYLLHTMQKNMQKPIVRGEGFVTMRLHMSVQKQFWSWISKIFLKILHILWSTSVFFRENTIRRQCVHC